MLRWCGKLFFPFDNCLLIETLNYRIIAKALNRFWARKFPRFLNSFPGKSDTHKIFQKRLLDWSQIWKIPLRNAFLFSLSTPRGRHRSKRHKAIKWIQFSDEWILLTHLSLACSLVDLWLSKYLCLVIKEAGKTSISDREEELKSLLKAEIPLGKINKEFSHKHDSLRYSRYSMSTNVSLMKIPSYFSTP